MVLPIYSCFSGSISSLVDHIFVSHPHDFFPKFRDHILNNLKLTSNLSEISSLNSTGAVPSLTLAHFRGMVQDIMDVEYFYPHYLTSMGDRSVTKCAYFISHLDAGSDVFPSEDQMRERSCYHVVVQPHQSSWSRENLLNSFKKPTEPSGVPSAVVKVYAGDVLKLNNCYDFYGVVLWESETAHLHVVHQDPVGVLDYAKIPPCPRGLVGAHRHRLMESLTLLFGGDELCAEYFLCFLICDNGAHQRNFPLNITGVEEAHVSGVFDLVDSLVVHRNIFRMTLESINSAQMVPFKDYDSGRLAGGVLQMTPGTVLVVDECGMTGGAITEKGVANINALRDLTAYQRISYNFKFYDCEIFANLKVVVLSRVPSILKCRFTIPLECTSAAGPGDVVDSLRAYLNEVQYNSFAIPESMQKLVEDYYVERRRDTQGMKDMYSSDDFHSLLTLCRVLCFSEGHDTLDDQIWNKAVRMENMRRERMTNS